MTVTNTRSVRRRLVVFLIAMVSMCAGGCAADDMALTTLADVMATLVVTAVTLLMDQVFATFVV